MLVTKPNVCPSCGGSLPDKASFCPTCGTPLAYPEEPDLAIANDLQQLVDQGNQALIKAGAGAAEYAFGASCSLAMILIVGLLLVLFLFGLRDWTTLGVVAVLGVLIATLVAVFLARRARNATVAVTYHKTVEPEIEAYLKANQLSRQEFDDQAAGLVASGDPLSGFLSPTPVLESEP